MFNFLSDKVMDENFAIYDTSCSEAGTLVRVTVDILQPVRPVCDMGAQGIYISDACPIKNV